MKRRILTIGLVVAAALGLGALGVGTAGAAEATLQKQVVAQAESLRHNGSGIEVIVKITNNSSYDLVWAGDRKGHQAVYAGPSVLPPGYTTFFTFQAPWTDGGLVVEPSWQIGNTGKFIYPVVGVPLIGPNMALCTANEVDSGSPVWPAGCSIQGGYAPVATLTARNYPAS